MWFHTLRYTFTTLDMQNWVYIKTVSGMLGHFYAGFTLDAYTHITNAAQHQASQPMWSVLAETLKT